MKTSLVVALVLAACSHTAVIPSDTFPASKPADAFTIGPRPSEATGAKAWAEPISPEIVRSYPHLSPHIGQLLLGDETIQFVLGGMPAGATKDQILLETVFVHGPLGWEQQSGGGPGVLRFQAGKDAPKLKGFDREVTPEAAKWVYTFTSGETNWPLEVRFDRPSRIVSVRFPNEAPAGWHLRWDVTATDVTALADDVTKRPGVTRGFIARGGTDPVIVQAFSPLGYQHKGDLVELSSARGPRPDVVGFFVLAGPAGAHLSWSLAAEKSCRKPLAKGKIPEGEGERFVTCWGNAPHALLGIEAGTEETTTVALRRRLAIFVDQMAPLPVALHPGARLVARVPVGQKTTVMERRQGDDQRLADMTLDGSQSGELKLAPRDIGKATIHLRRKDARITQPVLVTLAASSPHGRDALTPLITDADARALSPWHAWVDRWPRTLTLPAGRYDLEVSHRMLGKPCRMTIDVVGDKTGEWTCPFEANERAEHERLTVSADFVGLWGKERESVSTHFGLALYRVANQQNAATEPGGVFVVEVEDTVQGYSAQVVAPSDELLTALGNLDALNRPHAVESLARAFRKTGANGLFVIGCPAPSVSSVEYARLVSTLRPDAIQVLGCGPTAREHELVAAAGIPYDASHAPILLPATTFSLAEPRQAPLMAYFPREAFPLTPRPLATSDWLPLMRAGRYGWGRDAVLLVKPLSEGELAARRGRNVSVHFQGRSDRAQNLRFVVLNEKGVVHERPVKPEDLAELHADIPMRSDRHWFRAELRGAHPQRVGEEVVLAGTGWIKLGPSSN